MKTCLKCGTKVDDNSRYCSQCGGNNFSPSDVESSRIVYVPNNLREKKESKVGLVLAIIAICLSWIPYLGLILATTSLIVVLVGRNNRKSNPQDKRTAELVLTIIACLVGVSITFASSGGTSNSKDKSSSIYNKSSEEKASSENNQSEKNLPETATPTPTPIERLTDEEAKELYISQCSTVDYKEVERNPDLYDGQAIVIVGDVIEVQETESWGTKYSVMRIEENYDLDRVWYVEYSPKKGESRILEGDLVRVYGECKGVYTYNAILGNSITIPAIDAQYIDLATSVSDDYSSPSSNTAPSTIEGSTGEINAYKAALNYLSYSAFSYDGLANQLAFEQYTSEEIQFAMDHLQTDWGEQALKCAKNYLSFSAFSYDGLKRQLEYDKYRTEEINYAMDNLEVDWNEQAKKAAENYMSFSSFSKSQLITQLEFEGYTPEQAEYGANAVFN